MTRPEDSTMIPLPGYAVKEDRKTSSVGTMFSLSEDEERNSMRGSLF
jgi:hypothetical protein